MERLRKILEDFPKNTVEYARKTFNIAVFGVRNNFVLAGILLIGFCVIAPAMYLVGTMDTLPEYKKETLEEVMWLYSVIAAYVGGLMVPAVMFGYVHKRRDRDFYHSMPVKRGQYFIGYLAASFVMFAVPYLLMCIIMGLMGGDIGIAFAFTFQTLALYIVIYAGVLIAMMFSGSLLSSIVTLSFLNTFPVIVAYCSLLLAGDIDTDAYMTLLSPFIYIFTPLTGGYSFFEIFIQGAYQWVLWVQLGIAAIQLVLSGIMYKFRRGETTMAVAFPKTRYVLQYGVMFLVALFVTSVYSSMYYYVGGISNDVISTYISTESIILTSIMVFTSFVIMNMILERNFRAAFHKVRHLFIFAGAYVMVLALIIGGVSNLPYWVVPIKTDAVLIRYETYVTTYEKPNENDEFFTDYDYGYEYEYGYEYDKDNGKEMYHIDMGEELFVVTDPAQVAELTKRLYEYRNEHKYENYTTWQFSEEGEKFYFLSIQLYTLKPGKKIEKGMDLAEIQEISTQRYYMNLGDISSEEMEHFTEGMDMMGTNFD